MGADKLSVDILHKYFIYNASTGIILWRDYPRTQAGSLHQKGHLSIHLKCEEFDGTLLAHRVAWALHFNLWPEFDIDHKDRVRSHNWISNLRSASCSQNSCNKKATSKTGYKGVHYIKANKKYGAEIKCAGKRLWIGSFNTVEEAARAYDLKAIEFHGDYASTNEKLGLL